MISIHQYKCLKSEHLNTHTTVPFTDNPQCPTLSVVSDLLCCSASDITAIPSSLISFQLTSNTLNVALPVMMTVDITNTYSSIIAQYINS